ncbi:MAG: virulence-associated protein E [Phenylobacterium sp.]|uniref:toprim domain-containing protein n=1 Tax=Phenylobacterium sp. TaxID=1871053 RepID=UPI0025DB9C0E|nr:toprim domain-containing protein [Phenylobacterium sp.]MBI1200355.1 virulence-associated protein E [Phenylobacterium sp.]
MTRSFNARTGLAAIARALGGETYDAGRRALVPAPGHGPADRSVSLRLVGDRLLAHSFGAADWREVFDDLRARGWIDADHRLCGAGGATPAGAGDPAPPDPTRAERVRAARALWASGTAVGADSPAGRHCVARGVDLALDTLGALRAGAAVPLGVYRDRGPRLPALLAGVSGPDGALTAVEVTYLDARGARSRLARPSRKLVGTLPAGSAVRLAQPAAAMLVAEGVFTTLSAMMRFGLPGWALLSTSNLRRWRAPSGVRRVLIAGDRGADGERSAGVLSAALVAQGVDAEVTLPPPGAGDWNDLLCAEKAEEGT